MTAGPKARAGFTDPPVQKTPTNSATNSARPIPTGAMKVAFVFCIRVGARLVSVTIDKVRVDLRQFLHNPHRRKEIGQKNSCVTTGKRETAEYLCCQHQNCKD